MPMFYLNDIGYRTGAFYCKTWLELPGRRGGTGKYTRTGNRGNSEVSERVEGCLRKRRQPYFCSGRKGV